MYKKVVPGGSMASVNKPYEEMDLKITVKTPVFVLNGVRLQLNLDAFNVGNKLHIIDWSKISIPNIGTDFNKVINYIRNQLLSGKLINGTRTVNVQGICGNEIHDANPEGLPPSTIKGMLRTAYIYSIIKNDQNARNNLINAVKKSLNRNKKPMSFDTELIKEIMRVTVNRGRTFDVFNRITVMRNGGRYEFSSYCVEVKHVNETKPIVQYTAIGLRPDSTLEFKVLIRRNSHVSASNAPNKLITINELKSALGEFSSDIKEFERKRGIQVIECSGGHPIRLGFGSGRRWKTVINLLEIFDRNLYDELTKYMSKNRIWDDKTVKFVSNKPVGWVCVDVQ